MKEYFRGLMINTLSLMLYLILIFIKQVIQCINIHVSHETSAKLQEVINWVILSNKCNINMSPILISYGAVAEN
jgi:hypothetical protein